SALVPVLLGLLGCAAFSEWIGLHAIFGAFVFGACLPRDDRILAWCVRAIEPLAIGLLMPVMFAVAGQHATPEAGAPWARVCSPCCWRWRSAASWPAAPPGPGCAAMAGATVWRWGR